jgi:hypothetical protein
MSSIQAMKLKCFTTGMCSSRLVKLITYFFPRTATSLAISGLEDSSKVYKGYSSYHDAHSAWDEFASTGRLPGDVAVSLGSKPHSIPPILLAPPHPLVPPTAPQRVHAYNHRSASSIPPKTLFTPHSRHTIATPSSSQSPANTGNCLNTIRPIVLPSAPSTSTLIQNRSAAALALVQEEAFWAQHEDFWVVFTGITPGVHQGRQVSIIVPLFYMLKFLYLSKASERAIGPFENPSFIRTSAHEHANQIFVDGYMWFVMRSDQSNFSQYPQYLMLYWFSCCSKILASTSSLSLSVGTS